MLRAKAWERSATALPGSQQRRVGLVSFLLPFLLCTAAWAQAPAPVLVESVPFEGWLAGLERGDAPVGVPSLAPDDLPACATLLASGNTTARALLSEAIENELIQQSAAPDATRRQAWVDALFQLDTAIQALLPALPELDIAPPHSLISAIALGSRPVPVADNAAHVAAARAQVIRWLGWVLDAGAWQRLEPLYQDAALRDAVLDVWSQMQDPALRLFLETRMLSTDESEQLALADAYAAAYPDDYVNTLTPLAKNTLYPAVFWRCLDLVSAKAVLPSQVSAARPDYTAEESQRYVRYTLRAAHAHAARGGCEAAERVYLNIAEQNVSPQSVRGALEGLAACGYADLHRAALGYINDPTLRGVIIAMLAQHLTEKTEKDIQDNWDNMPPLTQSALLEIFQRRDAAKAAPLLTKASTSPHTAVRYQAAVLLGETPIEEDLWELASTPPDWLREDALRAYLKLAEDRRAKGDLPAARQQYLALLQGGMPLDVERAAIDGLGEAGEAGDKVVIEQLADEQPLKESAERALVALAGRSGDAEAKATAVGNLSGRDVPQSEMDALVAGIEDVEARRVLLQRAGFVTEGSAIGPFPMGAGMPSNQLHFPIVPYPIPTPVSFNGTDFDLKPMADCADGIRFDLAACLSATDPATNCAYVVYELRLPALAGVYLHVSHDDGFAMWINGAFQRAVEAVDADEGDWYRQAAVLEPGLSYLVLKVPQAKGAWKTGLRVTHRNGKPLDLTTQAMPEDPTEPVGVQSDRVKSLMKDLP